MCTACVEDPKSHYMQVVGHDLLGRWVGKGIVCVWGGGTYSSIALHVLSCWRGLPPRHCCCQHAF